MDNAYDMKIQSMKYALKMSRNYDIKLKNELNPIQKLSMSMLLENMVTNKRFIKVTLMPGK